MRLCKYLPLMAMLLVAACTSRPPHTEQQAGVDYDLLLNLPEQQIDYAQSVRPILDGRCVVCHGCYDAPCQLKLSSFDGLARGASPIKVYDGARLRAIEPTRLNIDAKSAQAWRAKGFHPVLAEGGGTTPLDNLQGSVLYHMLRLKQRHPQPRVGTLSEDLDPGLDRAQVCTTAEGFTEFARQHPQWGMPYGLPNLSDGEYATLVQWIAQGAVGPEPARPSAAARSQIERWEAFLNAEAPKQRLVSRYLYEHLVQAHIHLSDTPEREFYRLVRSTTPPGSAVDEIPSLRPYDDPGPRFYYRLLRYQPSLVVKDHNVYVWSPARLERYRELFIEPDYPVNSLPGYDPVRGANPFKVFEAIPPISRYRFLLDDARFFIEGFIKGPVCRGQIALNVIEDQFWVFFLRPHPEMMTLQPDFLDQSMDYLDLPAERGDDSLRLLTTWLDYLERQRNYLATKNLFLEGYFNSARDVLDIRKALELIWNGGGQNPNAALTVFRHYDSASVTEGLVGDYPETAWVIDYPIFERIHYLLVAGFNVYGNLTHQLTTRLYMDFLRMEAENQFLLFLPVARREQIRDSWYQGMHENVWRYFKASQAVSMGLDTVKGYATDDPKRELFRLLQQRLGPDIAGSDPLNRCESADCDAWAGGTPAPVSLAMRRIAAKRGESLVVVPDVSFVHVRVPEGEDLAYTIILNKGYSNITSMFESEDRRDRSQDTLTVVEGLEGSYPNFFFRIDQGSLEDFTQRFETIAEWDDYARLIGLYGIRRSNPAFWEESDWFHARDRVDDPLGSGIYDYNRYRNR